jgi:uncharacterized protein (TIGR00255 family)
MMKSMTGYGRGKWEEGSKRIEVEMKSFNHRYLDVFPHLPRRLNPLEGQVRNFIKQRLSRGRIDVYVQINESSEAQQRLELDWPFVQEVHLAMKALQERFNLPGEIRLETLAGFKEIFTKKEVEPDLEKEWIEVRAALEEALAALEAMRFTEGNVLTEDLTRRLDLIAKTAEVIRERSPAVLTAVRDRLGQRVKELVGGMELDEGRLAQEVAYLAERSDITEELVRIHSHLTQFRDLLKSEEPVGRKMEFLLQEVNREVNTIASKANDAQISQMATGMKSEVEKIREQIQNVE